MADQTSPPYPRRKTLDVIADIIPLAGARVVDVGCGPGVFRRHLAHAHFTGLDPYAEADEAVIRETLEEHAEKRAGYYDAATAYHVIEHVPDPLRHADAILVLGGQGGARYRLGLDLAVQGWASDLVVSNPPYIPTDHIAGLDPEVREHDPHLALDGGPDGLQAYRDLAPEVKRILKPLGVFAVEIGFDQGPQVKALFEAAGFTDVKIIKDLGERDRVVTNGPDPRTNPIPKD